MKYAEQILNNESARCMLCVEAPCTAAEFSMVIRGKL